MKQFAIQVALHMIWWMWFSWLSLNREIHPYPCNNSFYSLLMARVGCVSWFHGCYELGAGFLVLMPVIKTCETCIAKQLLSLMLWWLGLDVSHASMDVMNLVFYCLHLASPSKQTCPPFVLFYLILQQCHQWPLSECIESWSSLRPHTSFCLWCNRWIAKAFQ